MQRLGLQQRRHPVIRRGFFVLFELVDFVGPGLIPGQHHIEHVAVDGQVLDTLGEHARAVSARQTRRDWIACFWCAAANHHDGAPFMEELHDAAHEVVGALVRVAFLEQHASGGELPHDSLARERIQILGLQPIQRRKRSQQAQIERLTLHRGLDYLGLLRTVRYESRPAADAIRKDVNRGCSYCSECQPASGANRSP